MKYAQVDLKYKHNEIFKTVNCIPYPNCKLSNHKITSVLALLALSYWMANTKTLMVQHEHSSMSIVAT